MAYASNMPGRSSKITPSDTNVFIAGAAGIRVANKSNAWATVAVELANTSPGSVQGKTPIVFDIAPSSVDYIPGIFSKIFATGTTISTDVVIHSFHDPIVI